ncbi:class I SAM-dependent methyltransferase [Streptomyces poonensis]|uniref:SAM-dependent methyltransferase n=1 Tax=Streptomyces poonensis TaxID=68255 RepID=A0A918PFW5_9ACTN|nr:class I SAM-dependent methyltransferase [Streptomyces poonensis]GGZ04810.1 SAM-dependent methyltransferase [Streptomyces poonensis]GLJ89426.1 SAM-dependent methyltransferase [Streptomyces poonensis]
MGHHQHTHTGPRQHAHAGHQHLHTDMDWAEMAAHLEAEAELFSPLYAQATAWLAARRPDPGLVVDAGSGPGVVTGVLADAFPRARIVAVDGSGPLLERARARAERGGLADRFSTLEAGLPDGLDGLEYPADLLWASRSLHHLGNQRAALAAFAARLAPGGTLAILEGGLPARFLPRDIGIGRPGLQERLDAAHSEWFTAMRAALPDAVEETEDWPGLLTAVGLRGATSRTFLLDIPAPVPEEARAFVVTMFGRLREAAAELLDASDLATLDRLLDPDDKAGLHHRPDVFVLTAHTLHVAQAQP